jgi:HK97 family phage major capsid protein
MKYRFNPLYAAAEDQGSGSGSGISEQEFRQKVLDNVTAVKKQHEVIDANFQALDKQSKQLAADFGSHVKAFEGLPNQVATIERSLENIRLKQSNERRSNFGSHLERICGDPIMRDCVNGVIRMAANKGGTRGLPITEAQKKGALDYIQRTGLLEASGAGAGYIYTELLPAIYGLIAEYGIWNKFDVIPLAQNAANMIVDTTDPTMAWTAEATASSETNYAGGNVALAVGKLLGWMSVPNELLEDSVVDIGRYVLPKFANATAKALDWACTSADGTADVTDGGFTGIFGGGGTAAVAASGNISMATLDLDDFIAAMAAVNAAALSKQCYWWIHPTNLVKALLVKDSNGRSIFLPATDAPAFGSIGSILGYPVILTHSAPATNAVNNKVAVFGDPMGLAVGLRSDFQFASSDQILFKEDSTVFRARARAAIKVKQATAFGVLTLAAS